MNDLIKIIKTNMNGAEVNSVNAREIHNYLEVKTHLSTWIKRAIEKYDFEENIDYMRMFIDSKDELVLNFESSSQRASALGYKVKYLLSKKAVDILIREDKYKKKKKKSNILYLITDGEYTKIGIASDSALNRLKNCQTGNPKKLWIEYEIIIEDAITVENNLHKKYADKRLMGEWFALSQEDIKDIKEGKINE